MRISIINPESRQQIFSEYLQPSAKASSTSSTNEASSSTSNAVNSTFQNQLDQKIQNQSDATSISNLDTATIQELKNTLNNQGVSLQEPIRVPGNLEPIFKKAAETYGVDEGLLISIAKNESNFRSDAKSSAGAMGIMQLMPGTAQGLGVTDAYDPEQNIMGAAKLLSGKIEQYNGNVSLALAAYSAGSGNVKKYDGIPPFTETQNYIPRVLSNYSRGYVTDDGSSSTVYPATQTVINLLDQYNQTNGSATGTGRSDLNDRQKNDLTQVMMQTTSRL